MVTGDKTRFIRCGFFGLQDTLWDDQGRHYYQRCTIQGAVDFIFGSGQSIFEVLTFFFFFALIKFPLYVTTFAFLLILINPIEMANLHVINAPLQLLIFKNLTKKSYTFHSMWMMIKACTLSYST